MVNKKFLKGNKVMMNFVTFELFSSKLQILLGVRGEILAGFFTPFKVLVTKRFGSFKEILDFLLIIEYLSCLNVVSNVHSKQDFDLVLIIYEI